MSVWTISDLLNLVFLGIAILVLSVAKISYWWMKRTCQHLNYHEDRSGHAICCRCSKDLGFIGDVRKQNQLH